MLLSGPPALRGCVQSVPVSPPNAAVWLVARVLLEDIILIPAPKWSRFCVSAWEWLGGAKDLCLLFN